MESGPVPRSADPVERLMTNHPGRQLVWFLFVAAVATTTTVGVVAEVNASGNDRNLVGGIFFFLFAMLALVLAGTRPTSTGATPNHRTATNAPDEPRLDRTRPVRLNLWGFDGSAGIPPTV